LGFAYFDAGRPKDAVEAWRRSVVLSGGQYADALAGMAVGLEALGRSHLADRAYAVAISVDFVYKDPDGLVTALLWSPQNAERLKKISARRSAQFEVIQ